MNGYRCGFLYHVLFHVFPLNIGQTFSLKYKHFSALYPSYIDSSRSIKKGGRRIAKEIAVEAPTIEEISIILQSMNVRHVIQPFKCYPRDVGYIPREDTTGITLMDDEADDEDKDADPMLSKSLEDLGEIAYPPKARGRILVDMAQAEERWLYHHQQKQKALLSNMDVDIPLVLDEEEKHNKKFTKHLLLEIISKEISLLPQREERIQQMKKRNKRIMALTYSDSQSKKKQQDQGKKKKK